MPTIARRYRLISQAGSGGMAQVWRAVDTRLDRTVAVKLLLPELAGSARARDRAVTEARAVARINHQNIAAVYDVGRRRRVPYLVMEYVDGETLDRRLGGPSSMPWRAAARIAVQVADGLAAAHLHRVVHRDIKPGNIMLTASRVKVVDFGLASILGAVSGGPSRLLLGTPEYMAPEQLRGEPVSPATDVYALGLVLFQMLTGALPWSDATRHALVRHRRAGISVRLPPTTEVPAELVAAVDASLAEDPERRPSSRRIAEILRETLQRYPDEPAPSPPLPPPVAVARGPECPRHPCTVPWRSGSPRRRRRTAVLVALGLLVAAGGWLRPLWPTPAATAGEPQPGGDGTACSVRYVGHRTPTTFTADLAVTGAAAPTWTLAFTAPPGQRVTRATGSAVSQSGTRVVLSGTGTAPARITIAGALDQPDTGFPAAFELDGVACQRTVSIYTVAAAGA
ncbi:protein kinase domain-containing protein [Dactylosporangium sp. CS-033363]|uniref:serine/threonine-protein kinase n=1 Tax=Dactylosporangium sp. CS-033363 TaxID=3239935 RepID=UPI003D8EDC25